MSNRYKIRQNLISIGDDFWIEDETGRKAFKVNGKVLRIRKTLAFEDAKGRKLAQIQERLLTVKDTMVIEDADGKDLATVKKALLTPLRDKWNVNVRGGQDLAVQGNILDFEYDIKADGKKVAEISKKILRLTDTYAVDIAEGQNDILILAIAIAVDMMAHDDDKKKDRARNKD